MSALAPGGPGWLLAICASRVGSYMVYIAYAATLPVLQREWNLSGTAAGSIASAFQIAYAVSLMGCSALADRVGEQAAIRLYERLGFRRIPPFGPYTDDPVSRCYEKSLAPG